MQKRKQPQQPQEDGDGGADQEHDKACLARLGWTSHHVLGRGTTATVYCCTDHSGAPAAVKVLRQQHLSVTDSQGELAVLRALRGLGLRGVAQLVSDPVCVDERLICATEYCRTTLQSLAGCCCPLAALNGISQQLLRAVAELHGAGLVHGDIKPSNVLWSAARAELKLGDFGLTFGTVTCLDVDRCTSRAPTGALHPVSSSGYRAPEAEVWNSMNIEARRQAVRHNQKPCGTATDAWSCGVLLCELFSGDRFWPFSLASVMYPPETCDHVMVTAMTSLSALSTDALAEAHSRWRRQIARARELLEHRCQVGSEPVDEEAHNRSFAELVLSLLRFQADIPRRLPTPHQPALTSAVVPVALVVAKSRAPGAIEAEIATTQDDCLDWVTRKAMPTRRLDCARALSIISSVASARSSLAGGGAVVSIATAQQQQEFWTWQMSLLPSRFLLLHGLLVGDEVCIKSQHY